MKHTPVPTSDKQTVPADFEPGYLDYQARQAFRDLCRLDGFEAAREKMATIINEEREGRRQ
jgi:hypothetical protein